MSSRRLIVGLGNPGPAYADTRHNLGFEVVARLAGGSPTAMEQGELCRSRLWRDGDLLLAQPQTFMNRSGLAVRCLVDEYSLAPEDVLVVYDEVALPLGALRLRPSGRAAGHRGLESVIYNLQTSDIPRLRLGIGQPVDQGLADYVLDPFTDEEQVLVQEQIGRAAEACRLWVGSDFASAMNQVNQPAPAEAASPAAAPQPGN